MKHLLKALPLLALATLLFTSCKKDKGESPSDDTNTKTTSDTYQPLTTGSTWKYVESGDTTTHTITGATQVFGGKTYTTVEAKSKAGTDHAYYYVKDHVYILRQTLSGYGDIAFTYLNDTAKVNATWTANVTDGGTLGGIPARMIGAIAQKGISKAVNGKTYTNVIHSTAQLQYNLGGYTTLATYDFYAAKGIGLIEIDASSFGFTTSSIKLASYQIK